MTEEVQLRINDNKGAFYIEVEGKQEAMMTFVFAGEDKIIIDHTEVNLGNEGKGFGKKMVTKAVEFAREKGIKILPLCPFAKSVFDKTPEFHAARAPPSAHRGSPPGLQRRAPGRWLPYGVGRC